MSEDRRLHRRRDAFKIGTLAFGASVVECLVWEVSESGAQIEVASPEVPNGFVLAIDAHMRPRRCRIVRREGRRIAVAFEDAGVI